MDQHFDAERLAAFAGGSLSREERAAAEAHAADCPRCLQLLAAMVRTEDPAVQEARRSRHLPVVLRWSVPLLAGATALAIWINVRQRPAVEAPPVPIAAPATISSDPTPRPEVKADAKEKDDQKAVSSRAAEKREIGKLPQARVSGVPLADKDMRQFPTASPVPAPSVPVAAPPSSEAPKPLPGAAGTARSDTAERFRAEERLAESVTVSRNAPALIEVVSPDASSRWRVAGKTIARSSDGGKTWTTERVPVQGDIVAGASPSPLVAWFVGRGGYILLTTGTNQWRRVIMPESADLASISAQSESEAQVTTSDGRVFATVDGGRTWTRR